MAVEQREHPRFTTYLNAALISTDGQQYPCQVLDYSQTGVHLLWPHGIPASTQQLTLQLAFEDQPVKIAVDWVFNNDQHAGVQFRRPDNKLFLRLQEYNQATRNQRRITDEQKQRYLQLLQQEAANVRDRLLRQWLPDFLEATFEKANMARNTAEQQQWLRLEKQAKSNAGAMLKAFQQRLQQQLQRWLQGEPEISREQQPDQAELHLSLVQQADFEDWLLAKVTASHLQSRLANMSFELRQLLDTLSAARMEDTFNPIGPSTVTEAFRDSLDTLQLPQEARALAFSVYEQVALTTLQTSYQNLIRQIDIPLTFRYRRAIPAVQPAVPTASATTGTNTTQTATVKANSAASVTNPPPSNNRGQSLQSFQRHQDEAKQAYANIQNLLSLRYQRLEQAELSPEESLPVAAPEQVSTIVTHLAQQHSLAEGHVRESVEKALAAQEVSLPADSRDAIDTLEQVTQHLLSSEQVADFIKPFIERLGWPLLQLMLKDPSLLFNPEHPGRLVLNQLAKLGQLTTSGETQLSNRLQGLIDPVLQNLDRDEHALEELLENLQSLVGGAERKARQNAERVAQAAEGEHKLHNARRRIEQLIGKDIANRTLPNSVVEWLQQGWQPLLSLLLLREGKDSKRFQGAIKLYRQVLALFSAANSGRQELLPKFRPLLDLARTELDKLHGNLPAHELWHQGILQAATEHLQSGTIPEAIDLPAWSAEPAEVIPEGRGTRRAMNLQVGDWLLLVEPDQAVSVVWIAQDASRFACVNHSGMKVVDFTLAELATAFDSGRVKRLYEQEESAVDRGVDKLVQQIYRDLSEQANIDPLTGLTNRQHFLRLLQERILISLRSASPCTLLMADLDQFKLINKNYGVEGGDLCLQQVAGMLREHMPDALCARLGSNEFALFFPHTDTEQAEASAKILKRQVETTHIDSPAGTFSVHLSIGLATTSADSAGAAELIEQAESACQLAKEKGGSRIVTYQTDDTSRQRHEEFMAWGNKLNQALSNNQLQVLCVPIKPIQERHRDSRQYEILISIRDERGAQIPPQDYLQAAENYNRMYLLDRWTLEQLVQWLHDHPQQAAGINRFVLRLSGHAINDESLLAYIFEQAREKDVPVKKLCFELNETSAIRNLEDAADFMHEMRSLGCQFVLSDFGTGQSSFEYLKALPVDYVKIDHSFIDGLHASAADYALVKSIQEIAHFMAKKTIAEYSPNNNAWEILRTIGIDFVAGAPNEYQPLEQLG